MMKFNFKNLGPVKEGTVALAPLTIICGRNNVGKTYISHAIYACMLEAKKNLNPLNPASLQVAIKLDREIRDNFGIKISDIRNLIPSAREVSAKVNSALSKGGLAKFFNSDAVSNEAEISFEFDIDIEAAIFGREINIQQDIDNTIVALHKPENSFTLTTTYKKEDNTPKNSLGPAVFELILMNEEISSLINLEASIATSERTGIALFQPIFDALNTKLGREVHETKKMRQSTKHIINSMLSVHNLPRPVLDNLDFVRANEIKNIQNNLKNSGVMNKIMQELCGGEFLENSNTVEFKPSGENITIPFSMASSSSKSIYLIEKFIRKIATPGSILIIDEPELNLHIDNQIKMANLLAALVNSGVQVVITTHSDYLLREINILMMLGSSDAHQDEKNDILQEYNINEASVLDPEKVAAYVVSSVEKKVFKVSKTKYGLDLDIFNREIIKNNRKIKNIQSELFD